MFLPLSHTCVRRLEIFLFLQFFKTKATGNIKTGLKSIVAWNSKQGADAGLHSRGAIMTTIC